MVRTLVVLVLAAAAACASPAAQEREPAPAAARHGKPVAPVTTRLETKAVAAGTWDVTLIATTTADVAALTLTLDGKRTTFGATPRDTARTLVARVALRPGEGRDVVGVAEADGRSRAIATRVGVLAAPAPAPAVQVVAVPGLGDVAEVRQ